MPRHISPHSLRHAAITKPLDADVPLRAASILAGRADPHTPRASRPRQATPTATALHFLAAIDAQPGGVGVAQVAVASHRVRRTQVHSLISLCPGLTYGLVCDQQRNSASPSRSGSRDRTGRPDPGT